MNKKERVVDILIIQTLKRKIDWLRVNQYPSADKNEEIYKSSRLLNGASFELWVVADSCYNLTECELTLKTPKYDIEIATMDTLLYLSYLLRGIQDNKMTYNTYWKTNMYNSKLDDSYIIRKSLESLERL